MIMYYTCKPWRSLTHHGKCWRNNGHQYLSITNTGDDEDYKKIIDYKCANNCNNNTSIHNDNIEYIQEY